MITRRDFARLAALVAAWPRYAWSQAQPAKKAKPAPGTILVNDVHSQLNSTRVFRISTPQSLDEVRAALRAALRARLPDAAGELELAGDPTVVLVVGVNGSGKTTTIAKLAHRLHGQGRHVLVGACDTYRAAAADQLEIWADRSEVQIVRKDEGADPAAVAFEALEAAQVLGYDVVLLDTAGRLHTHKNLMEELKKIQRVVARKVPGAPHEVWLVLDATNGQNAIQQAKLFTAAVPVTGLVLAKLDGTARGGAVFGIQRALGLPVRFVGTGESKEGLEPFEPEAFVDAILAGPEAG